MRLFIIKLKKMKDKLINLGLTAILLVCVCLFFQWKISKLQDEVVKMDEDFDKTFKTLEDGVSARSEVNVIAQPNLFDKIFNTALNKQFKEIKKMIPEAVSKEMKNLKIENSTTTITKSSFVIEGDSAYFLNKDGLITKVAKVQPIGEDSSLLIIVPQEIELTTVQANPDPKDNTKINVFVTAYNKTTGDSLKIDKSITYVIPGKSAGWKFGLKPYVGLNYDVIDGGLVARGGFDVIEYSNKKFSMKLVGVDVRHNLKNQNSLVDLKLIQLMYK